MGAPNSVFARVEKLKQRAAELGISGNNADNLEEAIKVQERMLLRGILAVLRPQLKYIVPPSKPAAIATSSCERFRLCISRGGGFSVPGDKISIEPDEAIEEFGFQPILCGLEKLVTDAVGHTDERLTKLGSRLKKIQDARRTLEE